MSQRTHQLEGRDGEEAPRSGFVSLETWHVTNEDSPTGEEEEGGAGW
jgi:hypothetical protein